MTSDTQNPGGWPDPARPGAPENPERKRSHLVIHVADVDLDDPAVALYWNGHEWLMPRDTNRYAPHEMTKYHYLGPCLLPAEVAAREAAAREEGRLSATLDAPTQPLDDPQWDATDAAHPAWWRGNDHGVAAVVQIINDTLDGKAPGTYGSAALTAAIQRVAAARADGMREAARIAVKVRQSANDCAREPDLIPNIRREYLAQARGAEDVEAAILAAIEKKDRTP